MRVPHTRVVYMIAGPSAWCTRYSCQTSLTQWQWQVRVRRNVVSCLHKVCSRVERRGEYACRLLARRWPGAGRLWGRESLGHSHKHWEGVAARTTWKDVVSRSLALQAGGRARPATGPGPCCVEPLERMCLCTIVRAAVHAGLVLSGRQQARCALHRGV